MGQTLTANTSGVADADGLSNVQYEYQWLADDADIKGATGSTYTLTDSEEGKTVKVQVSFTDDAGHDETLTSGATAAVAAKPNSPATGAPTISGTAQVGETLTADTSGIADADGLTSAAFTYQWLADDADINGTTGSTYTLTDSEEGKAVKIKVGFTDDEGNDESLTSAATAAVAAKPNSPATGALTISGTAQVGETLTADTSAIADADGLSDAMFNYQWLADDTDIQSATNSTYTLSAADEGKTISVRVSFTDDGGNHESRISLQTTTVSAALSTDTLGEPQNLELTPVAVGANGVGIKVSWEAPSATGDSDISGYRIQWKGGNQDYPDDQETRQTFVENAPYTIDTTSPTPIEGDELTVRVTAVNGAGAGVWSEKIGWLPSHTDLELSLLMREYADEKQTTFPWVLETWNYLDRYEVPVEVGPTPGFGSVPLLPCVRSYTDGDDGLKVWHVRKVKILQIDDPKPRIIIHEMAHAYTLADRVTDAPGPLAIAHLYFVSLNLQGDIRGCEPIELYADVLTMLTLDIDKSSYWKTCNRGNAERQAQALDVLRSAVNGEMPQWFADTYTNSEGEPDLERLWTDVQDLQGRVPTVVVYQLRNAFGGYCSNRATWYALQYADETLTQPWVDGGCPPAEPSSLEVISGNGELTLAWDAPASDGNSDVDGYIVQWRSGYQSFYGWAARQRREVLDSPTSLTYTISGLTNGVEYDVRVRAYNHIGAGQPLDVESVTPSEAAPPPLSENTPASGAPTISGTAQVGETLTADTSGITDTNGLTNATFNYQWLASRDTEISGATGLTYAPVAADEGKAISVRVSFTDDAGHEETLTSGATDAVVAAEPSGPPAKPTGLSATASHDSVTLTWNDPGDDSITGYVILRRVRENDVGGEFSELVPDTGSTATTYTDDTVVAGITYTYRIKAINGAGTSER